MKGKKNTKPQGQPLLLPTPVYRLGSDQNFNRTLVTAENSLVGRPEFNHITFLPLPTIEMQPNPYYRATQADVRRGTFNSQRQSPARVYEAIKAPAPSVL